jgi:hypothetical protein
MNNRNYDFSQNGFSPRQFAKRNGIGVTKTYQEINAGRLIAHKCGSRTIITLEEEQAWLGRLPKLVSKGCLTSKSNSIAWPEKGFIESEEKQLHRYANELRAKLRRAMRGAR